MSRFNDLSNMGKGALCCKLGVIICFLEINERRLHV